MVCLKSYLLAGLALANVVSSRRLFYNSGVLKGWDYARNEHKGTIEEDKDFSYKSGKSLKVTQTYDLKHHDHYRCQVERINGYNRNDERYYAFAFRVAENWEPVNQTITIAHFLSHRHGRNICGEFLLTGTAFWIKDRQLQTRIIGGNYKDKDCKRKIIELPDLGEVIPGKWHKVVFYAKWRNNRGGRFKAWFDGRKTIDKRDVATTVGGNWQFEFRVGLWPTMWHDQGRMEGTQTTREIWYDEIAIGTEYKDVDPDLN